MKKCTIVSGAPEENCEYIADYIKSDSFVIAADSGYLNCRKMNREPDLFIGDFDSSELPTTKNEIIRLSPQKDDTDTLSAIKEALKRGFDEIIIVCAIGSRFDHSFANVVNLAYCDTLGVSSKIITPNSEIYIKETNFDIVKSKYKYFSLFAFGGDCKDLTIIGAKYPLKNYYLSANQSLGQSNEILEDVCHISFKGGKLITILSND